MIRTFADTATEAFWRAGRSRRLPANILQVAKRKLSMLDGAINLADLRQPPGNRLEVLRGDRRGQHSIRINDQYRICFVWKEGHAYDVEITDYH